MTSAAIKEAYLTHSGRWAAPGKFLKRNNAVNADLEDPDIKLINGYFGGQKQDSEAELLQKMLSIVRRYDITV
jgi:hypothetical protein